MHEEWKFALMGDAKVFTFIPNWLDINKSKQLVIVTCIRLAYWYWSSLFNLAREEGLKESTHPHMESNTNFLSPGENRGSCSLGNCQDKEVWVC